MSFELALCFEWNDHAATNEFSIHKTPGNTYIISFRHGGKWYSFKGQPHGSYAFAEFLLYVSRGPCSTQQFENLRDIVTEVGTCPVTLNTSPEQYMVLKLAAKDPGAWDLLQDTIAKGG